jgi:hypothetical protein
MIGPAENNSIPYVGAGSLLVIGLLIAIPPVAVLIPAVAVKIPAIATRLLNAIEPPALSTNDRAPPDPMSMIGELTIMLPGPVPRGPSMIFS